MNQKRAATFLESPRNLQVIFTIKLCTHYRAQETKLSESKNSILE